MSIETTGSERRSSAGVGGIRTQINLPWSKAIEIALNSLKIRFWRSMITGAGIFLGIAFLCFSGVTALLELKTGNQAALNRQIWLCVMALLVCTVGITNSMLMSVSERFREIGTMKCLGALNSLIVRLFLIEALFMGFVASLAGWILGFLGVFLVRWASLGWAEGIGHLTAGIVFGSMLGCILIGGFLTLVAALLPAQRASQMPPPAALRTEV
jgi:putative ABC transport system permease protein